MRRAERTARRRAPRIGALTTVGVTCGLALAASAPAIAGSWTSNGQGSAGARAQITSITALSVIGSNCGGGGGGDQGPNSTLTVSFAAASWMPSYSIVLVYRGTTSGNEALVGASTAGTGSYVDTSPSTTSPNFYRFKVSTGLRWMSPYSNEVSATC